MGYLALYVAGRVKLFDGHGHGWKIFLFLAPFMGATVVAITRVDDYRHHWEDVVVGCLVGLMFAIFFYRMRYPALYSPSAGIPYQFPRKRNVDHDVMSLTSSGGAGTPPTAEFKPE